MGNMRTSGYRFEVTQDIIDEYECDGVVMFH